MADRVLRTWHHHHDGDARIVFCHDSPECLEDGVEGYDGLVCDGDYNGPCRWRLAWDVVTLTPQQPFFTHLEEVPNRPTPLQSNQEV